MEQKIPFIQSAAEQAVLLEALLNYYEDAKRHYDPTFKPKPGKRDRNVFNMKMCSELRERAAKSVEGLLNTDDDRRVIRNALQHYANELADAADEGTLNLDIDTVNEMLNRIPAEEGMAMPVGEARVERYNRWGAR